MTARRSLTADGSAIRITTPNYDYEYLCAGLREKRMVPILTRIRAHSLAEFGEPVQHRGEEFIYVLEGSIEVHLQFYTPVTLGAGQGIYIDSTMGRAYVARDCDSALVLAVCSGEDPDLDRELISLVEEHEVPVQGCRRPDRPRGWSASSAPALPRRCRGNAGRRLLLIPARPSG